MPQKEEPGCAGAVRAARRGGFGHLQGLLTMIKGLPLAYNKDFRRQGALFDEFAPRRLPRSRGDFIEEGIILPPERLEQAWRADFPMPPMWPIISVARGGRSGRPTKSWRGVVKMPGRRGAVAHLAPGALARLLHSGLFAADRYAASPRGQVGGPRSEGAPDCPGEGAGSPRRCGSAPGPWRATTDQGLILNLWIQGTCWLADRP